MSTNCPHCKLPIFHGPTGYAGPQCLCHWKGKTLPQMYDDLRAELDAMRQRAEKAEQRADELAAMVRATLAQQA